MDAKVVLVGAGSAVFTRGMVADMIFRGWRGEVALVDISPDALAVAEGLCRKMVAQSGARLRISAHTDRKKAFKGATVVICTIAVGGRGSWLKDVVIPRKYGVYQPVGDTVMPGGASRALRMIPAMVDIARDVNDICPRAFFFNYSNPMSIVCRGVRKATGADMTGLCHGVFQDAYRLAESLGLPRDSVSYTACGINHLTWFTGFRSGGRDLMPALKKMAAQKLAAMEKGGAHAVDDPFTWRLVDLFGAFPSVRDRHIAEFFPHLFAGKGAYYGRTLGVDAFNIDKVIKHGDDRFKAMGRIARSRGPVPEDFFAHSAGEHEQVVDIVENILKNSGKVYSANLPNTGQVPNLPRAAVVEGPVRATKAGMIAVKVAPLPVALASTLSSRLQWVELVVEAALERNRDKFIQALFLDGSLKGIDTAVRLADDLLAAHRKYLGAFKSPGATVQAGRGKRLAKK
jgi:alpha-galactosidase